MAERKFASHPNSVPGDFYVEYECCISCGVPQSLAPDLVAWTDEKSPHCYWRKQPATRAEFNRAIKALSAQELGCHRYAGTDPEILARIEPELCDYPLLQPERSRSRGPVAERLVNFTLLDQNGLLAKIWKMIAGKR